MKEWLEYAAVWGILKMLGALPRGVARSFAATAARLLYAESLQLSLRDAGQWFDNVSVCDVCGEYVNRSDRVDTDERHR